MKKVRVYECSLCGKRFESEWECSCHELAEEYWHHYQVSGAQSRVIFWDFRGEQLPIEFAIDNFENVWAMKIFGENMFEWCDKVCEVLGYHSPSDDECDKKTGATYFWDGDCDFGYDLAWRCLEVEKEKHLECINLINGILQKLN